MFALAPDEVQGAWPAPGMLTLVHRVMSPWLPVGGLW